MTSYSIQLVSLSYIKQKTGYLNYRFWGFIQMNMFSDNAFNNASMGRKVLVGKLSNRVSIQNLT